MLVAVGRKGASNQVGEPVPGCDGYFLSSARSPVTGVGNAPILALPASLREGMAETLTVTRLEIKGAVEADAAVDEPLRYRDLATLLLAIERDLTHHDRQEALLATT